MDRQTIDQQAHKMLTQQISFERYFDKFTERARRVLVFADEEAALMNHNYIGTEHILLGLLREEGGLAATVLKELGVELLTARAAIEHVIGRSSLGEQQSPGTRPMTPRVQVMLTMAVGETWRLPPSVDTEHLLLALVREGGGIGAATIENLGVPLEQVRLRVFQSVVNLALPSESVREAVRKSNVVTCRIDDRDMDAIDALVEVGVRSTRSDAAAWLIHAGIEANQDVFESVYATVAEIRSLRTKAQALAQQITKNKAIPPAKPSVENEGSL